MAGQALVAAGRTVPPDRPVHSLHAYFIRPGDPTVPLVYTVDRIQGRAVVHHPPGVRHPARPDDLHPVRVLPSRRARTRALRPDARGAAARTGSSGTRTGWPGSWATDHPRLRLFDDPFDLRSVGPLSVEAERDPSLRTTRNLVWLRVDGELPHDPLLHVCLMTYASDMTLLDSVLLGHGLSWVDGRTTGASLDHAMWFHRPFRADRWLLYAQESPVAYGGRGLARGQVFTAEGQLVVSVMQEGLIRTAPRVIENRRLAVLARGQPPEPPATAGWPP